MLRGFHLSLLIGPGVPLPARREVVEAIISVRVTQASGSRSGFQIQLAVEKGGLIERQLLPFGYFDPLVRVILATTINGIPTVLMDGLIGRQDMAPGTTPGTSTLTLSGEDISVAMSLIDLSQLIPYPAMTAEIQVATVIARYAAFGMIPMIIPSPFQELPNPLERWSQHQGTDLDHVTGLANDVGYVFYVIPGPAIGTSIAYWGPEIRHGPVQPALNVNMDAHTNVESLSFNFDGLSARMPVMVFYEENSHAPIPIPIPSVGILRPPLAAKPAIPFPRFERQEGQSMMRTVGIGLARAAQSSDNATASGTLDVTRYGRVLQARALVDVRGAGHTYDGTYYVKSVTHDIKRGEYKQSFSLAREGVLPLTTRVQT